jgi:Glycosyl hydrolases family 43
MTTLVIALLLAAGALGQAPAVPLAAVSGARPRSEVRIRDPFVLPDPATETYYIYSSTTPGIDSLEPHKAVVVYPSKDLETWEAPTTVFEVPLDHWGRETVWAPEVHRFNGKYYLFVTLTSKDTLPTPAGRPQNLRRGTEILVADRAPRRRTIGWRSTARYGWKTAAGTRCCSGPSTAGY